MAVRKFKPVTAGTRHKIIGTFDEITKSTPEKSLLSPHGQLDNFAFWPLWNRDPNDPDKHVPRRDGDLATLARSIRAEGWAPVNPADNESGSAYDLLLDYMRNVFVHAKAHDQIVTDGKRTIALFDTGLSRHDGKPVMCYCWRSRQLGRDKKNWLFGGFCTEDGALGEDDRRLQTKLFHLRRSGDWARLTPPVYEGRPDPAVSVPSAKLQRSYASAAAEPLLEPPET